MSRAIAHASWIARHLVDAIRQDLLIFGVTDVTGADVIIPARLIFRFDYVARDVFEE